MYSRWFNLAVIALWLSAMSWLMVEKVMPPLFRGEPPNYRTILAACREDAVVGWKISCNGRPVGWAQCSTEMLPDDLTDIHSQVHFDEFPLGELTGGWLLERLRILDHQFGLPKMGAESTLTIDSLGRLVHFQSKVRFLPLEQGIKLTGMVDGGKLNLTIYFGESSQPVPVDLPQDALVGDTFSPQTHLPGLRPGQSWKIRTYRPNISLFDPLSVESEELQATVEDTQRIYFDGRMVDAWLVVYRRDSGLRRLGSQRPQGRIWVRRDDSGTVLKQETRILGTIMTFDRIPKGKMAALTKKAHDGLP